MNPGMSLCRAVLMHHTEDTENTEQNKSELLRRAVLTQSEQDTALKQASQA